MTRERLYFGAITSLLAACAVEPAPVSVDQSEVLAPTNVPTIGGAAPSTFDLARMRQHYAFPLYTYGDLDGDQDIDIDDVQLGAGLLQGQSAPCPRAMDMDLDTSLAFADLTHLVAIRDYNELHLEGGSHISCNAFAPVAVQTLGVMPGRSYPLLLLADLAAQGEDLEVQGPALIQSRSLQDHQIFVSGAATAGDEIEIYIHTGYDRSAPTSDLTDGKTYVLILEVVDPHGGAS